MLNNDQMLTRSREGAGYLIESHPSGGVPIASQPVGTSGPLPTYLNDLLGTTLATVRGASTEYVKLTSFGQQLKAGSLKAIPVLRPPRTSQQTHRSRSDAIPSVRGH